MTKITLAKLGRKYESSVSHPNIITKKEKVDEAKGRESVTFIWRGKEITEMVSPGQIINKDKAYKRHIEKQIAEARAKRNL